MSSHSFRYYTSILGHLWVGVLISIIDSHYNWICLALLACDICSTDISISKTNLILSYFGSSRYRPSVSANIGGYLPKSLVSMIPVIPIFCRYLHLWKSKISALPIFEDFSMLVPYGIQVQYGFEVWYFLYQYSDIVRIDSWIFTISLQTFSFLLFNTHSI